MSKYSQSQVYKAMQNVLRIFHAVFLTISLFALVFSFSPLTLSFPKLDHDFIRRWNTYVGHLGYVFPRIERNLTSVYSLESFAHSYVRFHDSLNKASRHSRSNNIDAWCSTICAHHALDKCVTVDRRYIGVTPYLLLLLLSCGWYLCVSGIE